jgi:hypothetical protein
MARYHCGVIVGSSYWLYEVYVVFHVDGASMSSIDVATLWQNPISRSTLHCGFY